MENNIDVLLNNNKLEKDSDNNFIVKNLERNTEYTLTVIATDSRNLASTKVATFMSIDIPTIYLNFYDKYTNRLFISGKYLDNIKAASIKFESNQYIEFSNVVGLNGVEITYADYNENGEFEIDLGILDGTLPSTNLLSIEVIRLDMPTNVSIIDATVINTEAQQIPIDTSSWLYIDDDTLDYILNWKTKINTYNTYYNFSNLAIDDNGNIYFTIRDKYLYSLSSDSTLNWKYLMEYNGSDTNALSAPVIDSEGNIIFGGPNVYKISQNGEKLWNKSIGGIVWSDATIDGEGNIYVGSYDHHLYKLTNNGDVLWVDGITLEAPLLDNPIFAGPVYSNDGTIYIGSTGKKFYAIDSITGEIKWSFDVGDEIVSSAAIDENGTIYFGC